MGRACVRHRRVEKVYVCVCVYMYVCVCVYIYHHASFRSLYYERIIASYIYIYIHTHTHTHIYIYVRTFTKRKPQSRYGIFELRIELGTSWTRNRRINSASSSVCVCFFVLSVLFVCLFLSFLLTLFRKSA